MTKHVRAFDADQYPDTDNGSMFLVGFILVGLSSAVMGSLITIVLMMLA